MKVLSLHQPYASLVIAGVKTWETRPAPFNGDMRPEGVRGLPGLSVNAGERIAIHAAKAWATMLTFAPRSNMATAIEQAGGRFDPLPRSPGLIAVDPYSLPLGAILGTVEVVDCIPIDDDLEPQRVKCPDTRVIHLNSEAGTLTLWASCGDDEWDERDISDQLPYGNWEPGDWAIELADPQPFDEPIPAKGKQGVWRWDG